MKKHKLDICSMSDAALYAYLEMKYGPGIAQSLLDEMGKAPARRPVAPPARRYAA